MSDTPKPSNPISRFLSDEQDPGAAAQVFEKVAQLLTAGEEIAYIAVEKPLVSLSPDSVVLTNKRFILYRPKLFGRVEFEDYIWRDLHSAELVEGVINSRFLVKTTEGLTLTVENLPKVQARKIYAFAQQMEEFVREERRVREMEEKRASAGGINIGAAGAAAAAGFQGGAQSQMFSISGLATRRPGSERSHRSIASWPDPGPRRCCWPRPRCWAWPWALPWGPTHCSLCSAEPRGCSCSGAGCCWR